MSPRGWLGWPRQGQGQQGKLAGAASLAGGRAGGRSRWSDLGQLSSARPASVVRGRAARRPPPSALRYRGLRCRAISGARVGRTRPHPMFSPSCARPRLLVGFCASLPSGSDAYCTSVHLTSLLACVTDTCCFLLRRSRRQLRQEGLGGRQASDPPASCRSSEAPRGGALARLRFQHLCLPFRPLPYLTWPIPCGNTTGLDRLCPDCPPPFCPLRSRALLGGQLFLPARDFAAGARSSGPLSPVAGASRLSGAPVIKQIR